MSLTGRARELADAVQLAQDPDGLLIGYGVLLDRARERLAATGPDDPDRAFRLYLLGLVLLGAAVEAARPGGDTGPGSTAARRVDEGIETYRLAVRECAPTDPHLLDYRYELGTALATRGLQTESTPDAEEAVALLREVVARTPASHPHRAKRISGLGQAVGLLATGRGDGDGMYEAIELHVQALTAAAEGDPRAAAYLSGFGATLLAAAELLGDDELLHRARHIHLGALRSASPYDPKIPWYAFNLGRAHALLRERSR